jgi:uncharacterized membrane protein
MFLPNISIPFELPFELPLLLHPAVVHFVVAIPIVILLLEVSNLFLKRSSASFLSLFLLVLVAVFMTLAYFTGSVDGKETFMALSDEGKAELKEHKLLGAYLTYGAWLLVVVKSLAMALAKVRFALIPLLLLLIGVTFIQSKDGGEITYAYGANNEVVKSMAEEREELKEEISDLEEEVSGLEEKLESTTTKLENATQALQEAKKPAVAPVTATPTPTTQVTTVQEGNITAQ